VPLLDLNLERGRGRGLGGGAGDGDKGGDGRRWSSRRVRRVKADSKSLEFGADDVEASSEGMSGLDHTLPTNTVYARLT
jgi:hypothetical protein